MKLLKRIAVAATLVLGLAMGSAGTAGAWPWDPNVVVAGNVSRSTCPNLATVEIRLDNGQVRQARTNGWGNYGGMWFRLSGSSIGARARVWCDNVSGVRVDRRVTVFRPAVGNQISINL